MSTPTTEKLTEYALLLERFSRGEGTDHDRQEAKRLYLEHSAKLNWIEPHQVHRLACLVVEGLGGEKFRETPEAVLYRMPRPMFRPKRFVQVVRKIDHSAFVELVIEKRPKKEVYRFHVTTGSTPDDLRRLIEWLHKQ